MPFFVPVFIINARTCASWFSELEDCVRGSSGFPFVATKTVRDQLYQLDVPRCMGPDRIHPRVLKKLVDVVLGAL